MGRRTLILTVAMAGCFGPFAWGRWSSPAPQDYTIPAREQLFTGTLSGLTEAYRILSEGMNDEAVTGDKRELIFLHALARTGMLVFDRNDVAVRTSLIEIAQPFGVTVTGDKFFPAEANDPDRVRLNLPIDSGDPNCVRIPPGADVNAAAEAINTAILPEIDAILAELTSVTDTPAFSMTLTPAETGLSGTVEVDYGDVLSFKASLLAVKAMLYGAANPAYDLAIDLENPIFAGWQCDMLPASTTMNTILDAYPNLLKTLPDTGRERLSQTKQNLSAAVEAAAAAMDYITAETDDQQDDLLQIDPSDPGFVAARSNLTNLRMSLDDGASAAYTYGSKETFTLTRDQQTIGRIALERDFVFGDDETGFLELQNLADLPARWDVSSFNVTGTDMQVGTEVWTTDGPWWGWFDGAVSADGTQVTNLTFQYWAPWPLESGTITGLTAERTSSRPMTIRVDPNPVLAGAVEPRDMLPLVDAEGRPIAGTVGHGLKDDPTLGGVLPGTTQQDWIPGPWVAKTAVYRFWSPIFSRHFYTISEWEKQNMIDLYSYFWTLEGIAFYTLPDGDEPGSLPVYRFWSPSLSAHFYTISEDERDTLIRDFPDVWGYEGVAFYGYPPDAPQPAGTSPVFRFWSPTYTCHFYTISEAERDYLAANFSAVWTYEGIAWYAYPP
jgi:hypothetical protein